MCGGGGGLQSSHEGSPSSYLLLLVSLESCLYDILCAIYLIGFLYNCIAMIGLVCSVYQLFVPLNAHSLWFQVDRDRAAHSEARPIFHV